jgi:AcrR family transcriptional regulator
MTTEGNVATDETATIWMRPARPNSPAPGPQRTYSRAQITRAAIEIADADGLEAASMRQVAARIGAGAMSLYPYVNSRNDLLELMVDAVTGEISLPAAEAGDWRAKLTLVATEMRALWLRHPWLAAYLQGHPIWGPNSLRVQEFVLGALDEFGLSTDELVNLGGLYLRYVESAVRAEVGWAEEARRTKVDMREWMRLAAPHAREIVESGKYPVFGKVLMETTIPHMTPADQFEYGLALVLDSIAANLRPR